MRVRYGRWSGTQEPFPHEVTADAVLDELSEDLLEGQSPERALRRLLQRGLRGDRDPARRARVAGLEELRRRVEEARRRDVARMGLDGPLDGIAERLEEILDRERAAADEAAAGRDPAGGDADDARSRGAARRDQLDALPDEVAGRIAALQGQDWLDEQAAADFAALVDELRRDLAQAAFGRLAGALRGMDEAARTRLRDFLAELNDLVEADARGEDVARAFEEFKRRYDDLIPGDPATLDDLLAELARRQAAFSRMLAGLDPDQRAQLARMAEDLLGGDLDLQFQADRLGQALRGRFPGLPWDEGIEGAVPGSEPAGSVAGAVDWVEHLRAYEDLAEALGQRYAGARLEDVDEEALRSLVGDDAARDLNALRAIERVLEEAGALQRTGGRLELTPRGVRALGERALAQIYDRVLEGGIGAHGTPRAGGEGEPTGTTRRWRFGDPFRLDVSETVRNAIARGAPRGQPGARARVPLATDDFALAESERRVRAATVLLLDMSFSMPLRGNWVHAKRVALALQSLVASRFPEDRFYVVGFSDYARRLQSKDLLVTGWERVYGTNMQHAFMLARRLLGAHPADERQVIMVTDGEPTAHLEGQHAFFAWPPDPLTLRLTLAEAARLARTGATLNVFLLDHDPGAAEFVELMVSRYGGRIFYPDLHDLGSLVVRDFLRRRRRR